MPRKLSNDDEVVGIENVYCKHASKNAILVMIKGKDYWIQTDRSTTTRRCLTTWPTPRGSW